MPTGNFSLFFVSFFPSASTVPSSMSRLAAERVISQFLETLASSLYPGSSTIYSITLSVSSGQYPFSLLFSILFFIGIICINSVFFGGAVIIAVDVIITLAAVAVVAVITIIAVIAFIGVIVSQDGFHSAGICL